MSSPIAGPSNPLHPDDPTSSDDLGHTHTRRRLFIGPMPESLLESTVSVTSKKKSRWFSSARADETSGTDDDDERDGSLSRIAHEHALRFFLKHGGKKENWGEDEERGVKEAMLRRWRDSEWGRIHARRRLKKGDVISSSGERWVGRSFEVGDVLGVNVLDKPEQQNAQDELELPANATAGASSTTAGTSFVTADSHPPPDAEPSTPTSPLIPPDVLKPSLSAATDDSNPPTTASSSAPLLQVPVPTRRPSSSILKYSILSKAKSDISLRKTRDSKGKGKDKPLRVHYEEIDEDGPAPPMEVLQRTGSAVDDSSAGAAESAIIAQEVFKPHVGDVVMRDRMLVRVSYTKVDSVGYFDEARNRTTSHLRYEDWAEFLVVWRKDRLELYENYSFSGKEYMTGHKKLAFLVPLKDPIKTKVSLYSPVDFTFCLTCPPTPLKNESTSRRRWVFYGSRQGTNIFVFKTKSRSRGADWLWKLWLKLGGEITPSIEIHSPVLDTRVKIDIPLLDSSGSAPGYSSFTREKVISLCERSLSTVGDWAYLFRERIKAGARLELGWRREMGLDWVWLEEDVEGNFRDWAVLIGLATKHMSGPSSRLEIRLAEHQPTHVRLKSGTSLAEPPSIEGYLYRIKPNSQTKIPAYLTTHDGNIFSLRPTHAHPPAPPSLTISHDYAAERKRGAEQVLHALGFADMRSIVAVRRAFQSVVPPDARGPSVANGNATVLASSTDDALETTASDDEDEGGDEGFAKSADKSGLRMKRSFELLLKTGHVVRFEAHSRRVALEWITRLRALTTYWTLRQRADATHEMELIRATTGYGGFTSHHRHEGTDRPPEPPANASKASPLLGAFWNWCVMDGCRSIVKAGRLFVRRGLRGQYKHMQLALVSGHLVQFHFTTKTPTMHYPRAETVNLLDAYVCSGHFAAQTLPVGQYDPNATPVARRYQDGLEAEDAEEDMLFMIWYYPHPVADKNVAGPVIPPLGGKRQLFTFKARSKLERDAWCWALNCEIEKVARANKERERSVREAGSLVKP